MTDKTNQARRKEKHRGNKKFLLYKLITEEINFCIFIDKYYLYNVEFCNMHYSERKVNFYVCDISLYKSKPRYHFIFF